MPIVLAHLGPTAALNFGDTQESSSSSSGSGGGLHVGPAVMNWCSIIRKRKNYKIHLEEVSTLSGDCHTPRLRHHPLPRHRPINGHLSTRSCTEPPRRPGNSRQLFLGIQQNPLLGRLSAAIYSWGSHLRMSPGPSVIVGLDTLLTALTAELTGRSIPNGGLAARGWAGRRM